VGFVKNLALMAYVSVGGGERVSVCVSVSVSVSGFMSM